MLTSNQDYRLAPEHPYPAAVQDAVAAYRGLLGSGVSPAKIAIAGESAVTLEVTPGGPHVFQGFAAMLDEGAAALDSAGAFIRAHLAAAPTR